MTIQQTSPLTTQVPEGFDPAEHLDPLAGSTFTNHEADAVVAQIVDRYRLGALNEETTRQRIASVLFQTGIHREVAGYAHGVSMPQRLELSDRLSELLTRKVLEAGDRPFYDLNTASNGSASGWARQFAYSALRSEVRNIKRAHKRSWGEWHEVMLDPTLDWDSLDGLSMSTSDERDPEDHDRVEGFRDQHKRLGAGEKYQRAAAELASIIGVRPARRPLDMEIRDLFLGHLMRDPSLAMRSLAHVAAQRWPNEWNFTKRAPIHESLVPVAMVLWGHYTPDTVDLLLSRADSVAQTLALAAVSPRPRPSKTLVAEFAALLSTQATAPKARLGWRALATAMAESWVSSECDAVARSAFVSVEARRKAEIGHLVSRRRLADLVNMATAHPGAPLGATPNDVLSRLADLASQAFDWDMEQAA